jgi:hypothetical protein
MSCRAFVGQRSQSYWLLCGVRCAVCGRVAATFGVVGLRAGDGTSFPVRHWLWLG